MGEPLDSTEVQGSIEAPGARLRHAREARQLDVDTVARQLRLDVRAIRALEEDDYASFASPAFVSGYLRSYAKLLGVDGGELLRDVNLHGDGTQKLLPNISYRRQPSLGDWPMRVATAALVVGMVGLLGYWWTHQGAERVDRFLAAQANGPAERRIADEPLQTLPDARAIVPALEAEAKVEVAQPSAPALAAPEPPTPELDRLVLRFSADSWSEVRDASDGQLVYGLIKAGREVEVEGQAPFDVFLGYGPGVNLEFNGEPFEHQPYTRRDSYVARFTVGAADTQRTFALDQR